jgi:hypothetical protein
MLRGFDDYTRHALVLGTLYTVITLPRPELAEKCDFHYTSPADPSTNFPHIVTFPVSDILV